MIDPYSGSGTVRDAARLASRPFAGCDLYDWSEPQVDDTTRSSRTCYIGIDRACSVPSVSPEDRSKMPRPDGANPSEAWSVPDAPVLVVEDDASIRSIISAVLTIEDYAVVTAANGAEALEQVCHHQPSAILLDLNMPVLDGAAFLAAYRALPGPHAPVIVCSATYCCEELAHQLGADGCLPKPYDIEDLLATLRRFTSLSAFERAPVPAHAFR